MAVFTNQMRFTGMSGLEVNDMVTQLMQAHSVRLSRMRQNREVIVWQRDALRGVASDLRGFQNNWLSFTSNQSQNIRSATNFRAMNTNIVDRNNPDRAVRGVTVTPVDPNATGARNIEVHSVAQGDVFRSANSLNSEIRATSNLDLTSFLAPGGFTMNVELNGRTEAVSISMVEIARIFDEIPSSTSNYRELRDNEFLNIFNQRLNQTFGSDNGGQVNPDSNHRQHVWASFESITGVGAGRRLIINTRSGNNVSIANGPDTGAGGHNLSNMGFNTSGNLSTSFNPETQSMTQFLGQNNFNFVVNGTTVNFNGSVLAVNGQMVQSFVNPANLTVQHVMDAVNNSNAGVRMSFSASSGRITMESEGSGATAGAIRFADVTGGFFEAIGFGANHEAMSVSRIQAASVVNIPQLNHRPITANIPDFTDPAFDNGFAFRISNGTSTFQFFASADDIADWQADAVTYGTTVEYQFTRALNTWLGTAFGHVTPATYPNPDNSSPDVTTGFDRPGAGTHQNMWVEFNAAGELNFRSREGQTIVLDDGNAVGITAGVSPDGLLLENLGFNVMRNGDGDLISRPTNRFDPRDVTLAQFFSALGQTFNDLPGTDPDSSWNFVVNGEAISLFDPANPPDYTEITIQQIMDTLSSITGHRVFFDGTSGRFAVESGDGTPISDFQISGSIFEAMGFGESSQVYRSPARVQAASDAVVYIDGQRFVRATNSFELEGLRINLDPNQLSNVSPTSPLELDVSFERDNESVMQLIRDFVDGYNELIRSIRELSETRRPRQSDSAGGGFFMPLTDEQRAEMSEREIELWEDQARTGILHRDDTLRQLTRDLHSAIFQNVPLSGGGHINLLHIGIRTSSDLTRFGELQIDEDRVRYFVENHADAVTELFTNDSDIPQGNEPNPDRLRRLNESGIGYRINDILSWQMMYGGGLYSRAGTTMVDTVMDNRLLDRRIAEHDRRIDNQLRILQRRETRYFQIFSRLEAAMIQANSQMMFMEQMFWMA